MLSTSISLQPGNGSWYSDILLNAPDTLWIEYVLLPCNEVDRLAVILRGELAPDDSCVRSPLPLLKRVKLGNCAEYRIVGEAFGISKVTVYSCVK